MLCDYGCGKEAQHTLKNGKHCCSTRPSGCEVLKKLNSEKTKLAHTEGRHGYTWNPTSAWSKGLTLKSVAEVFAKDTHWSSELLRKYLHGYNLKEYRCEFCGITEWNGNHLVLELDHISGNRTDNTLSNLRWLCPNCHSTTETFRGRNKNSGTKKISDEELLTALRETCNIKQALQKVGLAAKGGNYERAKKLSTKIIDISK